VSNTPMILLKIVANTVRKCFSSKKDQHILISEEYHKYNVLFDVSYKQSIINITTRIFQR